MCLPCRWGRGSAACRKQQLRGRTAKGGSSRGAGESGGTRRRLQSAFLLSHRCSAGGEVVSPCGLGRGHGHIEQ